MAPSESSLPLQHRPRAHRESWGRESTLHPAGLLDASLQGGSAFLRRFLPTWGIWVTSSAQQDAAPESVYVLVEEKHKPSA